MDEETWFMGDDLKKLGKVLEDSEPPKGDEEQNEPQEIKIAALRLRMEEAKSKLKALKNDDTDKIAALIKTPYNGIKQEQQSENKGENEMVKNLEELKAQNVAVYNEAKTEGQKAEQKRVASLMKFIDIDKNAVIKAIDDGVGVNDDEFQASILAARTNKQQIAEMQEENPADVDPKQEIHAPENKDGQEQEPTEEEKAKAQKEAEETKLNGILAAMGLSNS